MRTLDKLTKPPTAKSIYFIGILPTNLAAIGAAIKPPMIRPAISVNGKLFNRMKKVSVLDSTTKNSVKQTDPTM